MPYHPDSASLPPLGKTTFTKAVREAQQQITLKIPYPDIFNVVLVATAAYTHIFIEQIIHTQLQLSPVGMQELPAERSVAKGYACIVAICSPVVDNISNAGVEEEIGRQLPVELSFILLRKVTGTEGRLKGVGGLVVVKSRAER